MISYAEDHTLKDFLAKISNKYELSAVRTDFTSTVFLGLDVQRTNDGYKLHQKSFIDKLVKRFRQENAATFDIPLSPSYDPGKGASISRKVFCSLVGSLQWLSTCTRPDVSFAVSKVAQASAEPRSSDFQAAIGIVRYLKGTAGLGLHYRRDLRQDQSVSQISAYVDADWGSCKRTRRSRTGLVIYHAGAPVHWSSRRQTCVALSSNEAEFIALNDMARELTWLGKIMIVLERPRVLQVWSDNQGAIRLVKSPELQVSKRTKHVDVRFFYSREFFARHCNIQLDYISTKEQRADPLTKALDAPAFLPLRDLLLSA